MKLKKKLISLAAALAITAACMTSALTGGVMTSAVDDTNDDWLHAVGSRLYDKDGNEVWLTGANWFGLNCIEYSPHYLYAGDIDDMLSEVADRGINVIRFPISTELIYSWMIGKPYQIGAGGMQAAYNPPEDMDDGNGGIVKAGTFGNINKDFVESDGKTLITSDRGFDVILDKCKKYGIKAFIDIHSPHADNSGHNYNLWYGMATKGNADAGVDSVMVTTDIWIETLVWIADKYKNNDTLIGYDLKNEPHGKGPEGEKAAKWDGSTDENNWAYAATKCADAILDVNPNALIFIEGVEQSLSGAMAGDYWGIADRRDNSPYIGAWWGGNFRGAREYPIEPKHGKSQIVYSPHDYGPSVYAQKWFEKDFTEQTLLDDYWYDTWAYINAEDIAPELIGEWGGHMDGAENQKWLELLRDYMIKHHINHTFWCLNTNSGDTGGLWAGFQYALGSGTKITWEEDKYALFEKALWQTDSGKYIGLDHQIPLGKNGTGLSLSEFYASGEGSNLDSGGKTDPKPPVEVPTDKPTTTTTKPAETTTEKPDETTAAVTTTTANSEDTSAPATTTTDKKTNETTVKTTTTKADTTTAETTSSDKGDVTSVTPAATTTKKQTSDDKVTTTAVSSEDPGTEQTQPTTQSSDNKPDNTTAATTPSSADTGKPASTDTTVKTTAETTTTTKIKPNTEGPTVGDVPASKYGDVNNDGRINVADVVALNFYILNPVKHNLSAQGLANADCVNDKHINLSDSTILMNYVAELISIDDLGKKL